MKIRLPQKSTLWATLGGAAYVLCFPQFDLPALSLLFLPALIFSIHALSSSRRALGTGFLLSAMVAVGGFHWIVYVAQNFGQMPFPLAAGLLLLFCLVAAPQMVAFMFLGFRLRYGVERLPLALRPLFWASLYTALEYLARFVKIFPEHLGNTFLAFPSIAQSASLGGVSLLSFLALFLGASLAYLKKSGRTAWPSAAAATALITALAVWGHGERKRIEALPSETLRVGLVQHNMEEVEKIAQRTSAMSAFDAIVTRLLGRSAELAEQDPRPDLIVWPETAYPILFPTGGKTPGAIASGYANLVKGSIAALRIPLLFGGYENDGKDYNSAILLSGVTGQVEATYRKQVLLVFGEYFPLSDWFPFLKTVNPQMGDFGRGPGPVPVPFSFNGRSLPLGVNICYEAILPEYMRGYARAGARLFVNLTKDSWFGDTFEPWQHLQLTAIRSIEHRIPMVRATNTGLSGVVLPTGETRIISRPFEEAWKTMEVPIPLEPQRTLYTALGEWFAWLTLALSFLLGGLAFRKGP
jgi:apolipoprotein N-acyltransferase